MEYSLCPRACYYRYELSPSYDYADCLVKMKIAGVQPVGLGVTAWRLLMQKVECASPQLPPVIKQR